MATFSTLEIIAIILLSIIWLKFLISVAKGIWTCFLAHLLGFGIKWRTGDGVWAVVTGGTDGIGLEYAKQLANIGYNLVIISRSEDKLRATEKLLRNNCSNCKEIKIISADFNRTDIYETIAEELNKLDEIFVLVNNVGTVYHIPEYYLKIPKNFVEQYFNVNMRSATKLIEIVLPKMVSNKRGVIINVSSQIGEQQIPLYTTYGATKAYLTFLSEGLSVEYESKGIYIQTVAPNQVKTKLTDNVNNSLISVSAEDYVRSAIKTVGIEHFTSGHWKHKLLAYLSNLVINLIGSRLFMKSAFPTLLPYRQQYYREHQMTDEY